MILFQYRNKRKATEPGVEGDEDRFGRSRVVQGVPPSLNLRASKTGLGPVAWYRVFSLTLVQLFLSVRCIHRRTSSSINHNTQTLNRRMCSCFLFWMFCPAQRSAVRTGDFRGFVQLLEENSGIRLWKVSRCSFHSPYSSAFGITLPFNEIQSFEGEKASLNNVRTNEA